MKTYRSKPHALYSVYLLPPLNLGLEWKDFRNNSLTGGIYDVLCPIPFDLFKEK